MANETIRLFHGSNKLFNKFEISPELAIHDLTTLAEGYGIYLTDVKGFAKSYGDYVYEVHVPWSEIEDMTSKRNLQNLIKKISVDAKMNLFRLIDTDTLIDGIVSGNTSAREMYKEINLFLDSEEIFYQQYGQLVTHEEDCIFQKIEDSFHSHVKDTIMYYDKSFQKNMYIRFRNPETLEIVTNTQIEIYVDVTPVVVGHNVYTATAWFSDKELFKLESNTSLRDLLKQLKDKALENNWENKDMRIVGEFYDSDLTEDDEAAWGTPVFNI